MTTTTRRRLNTYEELYESVTEIQESIILKAIEVSKGNTETEGVFAPTQVGLELGKTEDNASSYCTGALRKGIRMGIFEQPSYGKYSYTGKEYKPKYT